MSQLIEKTEAKQDLEIVSKTMSISPGWRDNILMLCTFTDSGLVILYHATLDFSQLSVFYSVDEALDSASVTERSITQQNENLLKEGSRYSNPEAPFILRMEVVNIDNSAKFYTTAKRALNDAKSKYDNKVASISASLKALDQAFAPAKYRRNIN